MEKFQLELFDIPVRNRSGEVNAVLRYTERPCCYRLALVKNGYIRLGGNGPCYDFIDLDGGPMMTAGRPLITDARGGGDAGVTITGIRAEEKSDIYIETDKSLNLNL